MIHQIPFSVPVLIFSRLQIKIPKQEKNESKKCPPFDHKQMIHSIIQFAVQSLKFGDIFVTIIAVGTGGDVVHSEVVHSDQIEVRKFPEGLRDHRFAAEARNLFTVLRCPS